MLTSFLIENFRLFRSFTIERLARINLVVGRNNSGKSALLEAIELYVSNGSPQVMISLVANRQETWKGQPQAGEEAVVISPVRHLFYGHQIPEPGKHEMLLGPIEPTDGQLHIYLAAYRIDTSEDELPRRVLVDPNELPSDLSDLELALVARENGKLRRVLRLDLDLDRESRRVRTNALFGNPPNTFAVVVPTRNMTDERLATLWDQISLTGLEEEVILGLQLLDPLITGVAFVEGSNQSSRQSRTPIIKLSNLSEPLPLRTMGDGMTRVFQLIVALVNAKNGILLIDEFENGLHWSVQPKVWQTVFRLAQALNVQVFATTHSRDCIEGYEQAWTEQEDLGAFFRLNARAESIDVTSYSYETLSYALETDVEIR